MAVAWAGLGLDDVDPLLVEVPATDPVDPLLGADPTDGLVNDGPVDFDPLVAPGVMPEPLAEVPPLLGLSDVAAVLVEPLADAGPEPFDVEVGDLLDGWTTLRLVPAVCFDPLPGLAPGAGFTPGEGLTPGAGRVPLTGLTPGAGLAAGFAPGKGLENLAASLASSITIDSAAIFLSWIRCAT